MIYLVFIIVLISVIIYTYIELKIEIYKIINSKEISENIFKNFNIGIYLLILFSFVLGVVINFII